MFVYEQRRDDGRGRTLPLKSIPRVESPLDDHRLGRSLVRVRCQIDGARAAARGSRSVRVTSQ